MADKIIKLADAAGNAKMWSPEQMLEHSLNEARPGGGMEEANKALVLFLTDIDEDYKVGYIQAGMSCSEILALVEVTKTILLKEMGLVQ